MAVEIERRFLVRGEAWRAGPAGVRCAQGYLCTEPERVVRVRLMGDGAWLTIKGATHGCARAEFEYPIPVSDARALLTMCVTPPIEKTRYQREFVGHSWVVDVFDGANAGLTLAEIELPAVDAPFARPPWLGEEVTQDARYCNSQLARQPYSTWRA